MQGKSSRYDAFHESLKFDHEHGDEWCSHGEKLLLGGSPDMPSALRYAEVLIHFAKPTLQVLCALAGSRFRGDVGKCIQETADAGPSIAPSMAPSIPIRDMFTRNVNGSESQ